MYPRRVRSVKDSRRGHPKNSTGARRLAAIVVAGVVAGGCLDDVPDLPAAALPAACPAVLRLPREPRIVALAPDGALEPGPPCASANCLVGTTRVVAWRDGDVIRAEVHGRSLAVPARPASFFRAAPALPGVIVGGGLFVVDRGEGLEVHGAAAVPRSLPLPGPPPLEGGWFAGPFGAGDGVGVVARRGREQRTVILTRPAGAPTPDAEPLPDDADRPGELSGWLLPGAPAAFVDAEGKRFDAGVAIAPGTFVRGRRGVWLVPETDGTLVVRRGQAPFRVPHPSFVELTAREILVVTPVPPGRLALLEGETLRTVVEGGPGRDLVGPLPAGTTVARLELALRGPGPHGRRAEEVLVVERLKHVDCQVEDRLVLVDVPTRSARVLAGGDVVRLHPTWAGDRFRFVEADPEYRNP